MKKMNIHLLAFTLSKIHRCLLKRMAVFTFSTGTTFAITAQSTPLIPAGSVGSTLTNAEIQCTTNTASKAFDFTSDDDSPLVEAPDTYTGEATAVNGVNSLGLTWEYETTDGGYLVNTSTGVRTNTADEGSSIMTISFKQVMENPILDFTGLQDSSTIDFFDCEGNPLVPVLIAETGSHSLSGNTLIQTSSSPCTFTSLQLPKAIDCFYYVTTAGTNIGYVGEGVTLAIRSCLTEEAFQEHTTLGSDTSYGYLNLTSKSGEEATAEAYLLNQATGEYNLMNVKLRSKELEGSDLVFALMQNKTNLLNQQADIGFNLPIDMPATINIFNVLGQDIKAINSGYIQGYNKVPIDQEELSTRGDFYFKLITNSFKNSGRVTSLEELR